MNNKIFIAMHIANGAALDELRRNVEGYHVFDRHGSAFLVDKYNRFGFSSVVPSVKNGKVRWFWSLLGCSYVYMPCGWQEDGMSRKSFAWAEFLNKKVIFEEDGRCR